MLLKMIKNETQFQWLDHTEVENNDIRRRLECFIDKRVRPLYEAGGAVLEPGDFVLDLGANIGLWSLKAILSGAGRILAYEPNTANYECAAANIKLHSTMNGLKRGDWKVVCAAIADRNGEMLFYETPTISQHSLLDTRPSDSRDIYTSRPVPTVTMDKIFAENRIEKLDYWKCDANGSEYLVVRGLSDANLQKIRKLAMQYHHWVAEHDPDFLETWPARLKANGFHVIIDNRNEYGDCYLHAWQE